jgi:hypothetical protein
VRASLRLTALIASLPGGSPEASSSAGSACPTSSWLPGIGAWDVHRVASMLDRLALLPLPRLQGERVILRASRESDVDDRLRHPIDPDEEDGYGSSWRREWDGRRYHSREQLTATRHPARTGSSWRYWPATGLPSVAIWPAASAAKASAGRLNCTPTAGKTSSSWDPAL